MASQKKTRPQRPSAAAAGDSLPPQSPFQTATMQLVSREQLQFAHYNPRIMSEYAAGHLRSALRRHGLVDAPVWNRRTGNVVGGHQRIAQLDEMHKGESYSLQVQVIDVDEKTEKEINVELNVDTTRGEWDPERLLDMFGDIKPADAGLDLMAIQLIVGDVPEIDSLFDDEQRPPAARGAIDEAEKQALIERKRKNVQHARERDDPEFVWRVVFMRRAQLFAANAVVAGKGMNQSPSSRLVDGPALMLLAFDVDIEEMAKLIEAEQPEEEETNAASTRTT